MHPKFLCHVTVLAVLSAALGHGALAETSVQALIQPTDLPTNQIPVQWIDLIPGWLEPSHVVVHQTIRNITIGGHLYENLPVRVVPGWLNTRSPYDAHANVASMPANTFTSQPVTILFDYPFRGERCLCPTSSPAPKVEEKPDELGETFVTASLFREKDKVAYHDVLLYPGWTESLNHTVSQIMVSGPKSALKKHKVRVVPGFAFMMEDDGFHARVYLPHVADHVTIYLDYEMD